MIREFRCVNGTVVKAIVSDDYDDDKSVHYHNMDLVRGVEQIKKFKEENNKNKEENKK